MKSFEKSIQIYVKSFSLSVIIKKASGHFDVVQLLKSEQKNTLLDSAYQYLNEKWIQYQEKYSSHIVIPVFCLHAPSPLIVSVESLLMPNLPGLIEKQIMALKLVRPFNVITKIAGFERTTIGNTIVDITSLGIVILGNVNDIMKYIRIYGSRYFCPFNTTKEIGDHLEKALKKDRKSLFDIQSMAGGFALILSVEFGFLINSLISSKIIQKGGYLTGFILSIACFSMFFYEKVFSYRLYAFSFPWTIKFQAILVCLACYLFNFFTGIYFKYRSNIPSR